MLVLKLFEFCIDYNGLVNVEIKISLLQCRVPISNFIKTRIVTQMTHLERHTNLPSHYECTLFKLRIIHYRFNQLRNEDVAVLLWKIFCYFTCISLAQKRNGHNSKGSDHHIKIHQNNVTDKALPWRTLALICNVKLNPSLLPHLVVACIYNA